MYTKEAYFVYFKVKLYIYVCVCERECVENIENERENLNKITVKIIISFSIFL